MEELTFTILWIRLLIEPESVEINRIKSYIIKSTLNVAALYFEDPDLVLTSVENVSDLRFGVKAKENEDKVPTLYWLPKPH